MIRSGWVETQVGSIAVLLRGISYKKYQASKLPAAGYSPVLRANNINGTLNFDDLVFVPNNLIKKEQFIKKGDIIFAMSSGSKHLVGKSAQSQTDYNGSYGAFCSLLRVSDCLSKKYVARFFQSNSFKRLISEIAKGTNINNLKREHIINFTISLPPLPEQLAIVAKLEQLLGALGNGIANLKAAKEKLETYRQSVLKTAFEGKLLDGEKDNPSNIVRKGWRQETISAVCEVNPPKPVTDDEVEITFLPMSSVEEETGKYCSTGAKRYEQVKSGYTGFLKGDVLFAKITPCMENGKVALIDKLPNQIGFGSTEFHVIRPSEEIQGKWLFYFLVQRRLRGFARNQMTGSAGQLRVPKSFIQNLRISFPSLPEQRAIVSTIESRFAVCDKLSRDIDEALEKSQAMRQSILKKAFDGGLLSKAELRECREQPDWEPAAKLLQRIKANKPSKPAKRKK